MNRLRHLQVGLVLAWAAFLSLGHAEQAQPPGTVAKPAAVDIDPSENVKLLDATLVDQEGQAVRFASEAVGDRIVAINFIYTSCTTTCPLASATFKRLQERLGERLGKEVRLISVSLDPVTDTPARLKDYAGRYKAKPGWVWLTGHKAEVDQVLNGLGTSSANFTEHPPLVMVGDGRRGRWSRFYALPGPEQILKKVEALLADRQSISETVKVSP